MRAITSRKQFSREYAAFDLLRTRNMFVSPTGSAPASRARNIILTLAVHVIMKRTNGQDPPYALPDP